MQRSNDDQDPARADDQVLIFDTTLRDGEQSPGCTMTAAEKLRVATALAELGVDVIEAGFPIASRGDHESVRLIARQVQGPVISTAPPTPCAMRRADVFTFSSPPAPCIVNTS